MSASTAAASSSSWRSLAPTASSPTRSSTKWTLLQTGTWVACRCQRQTTRGPCVASRKSWPSVVATTARRGRRRWCQAGSPWRPLRGRRVELSARQKSTILPGALLDWIISRLTCKQQGHGFTSASISGHCYIAKHFLEYAHSGMTSSTNPERPYTRQCQLQ